MLRKTLEVFEAIKAKQPEVKLWLSAESLPWAAQNWLEEYPL